MTYDAAKAAREWCQVCRGSGRKRIQMFDGKTTTERVTDDPCPECARVERKLRRAYDEGMGRAEEEDLRYSEPLGDWQDGYNDGCAETLSAIAQARKEAGE